MSYPLFQQPLHALVRPLALLACTAAATASVASPATPARRVATPNLPLTFEKNTGHYPREVQFVARGGGGTLFLTRREAVLSLRTGDKAAALRLKLQGSSAKTVASGLDKRPGIVNYFIGKDPAQWRTNVPTYSRVKLTGVYPGIDLVTYGAGKSRTLEYDFVVKPGADPTQIRMAVSGAKSLRTVGGRLVASTACGDVTLNRPYAYQTIGGVRRQVACAFTLERNTVAFQVARYDAGRPLVVDPTLEYSTYLGASDQDYGTAVAIDGAGAAYVTGRSSSTTFPTTAGAFNRARTGNYDAFVTKMAADGKSLAYSTYIGGTSKDQANAIAVDAAGSAFITGSTFSSDYPTTAGAYNTAPVDWTDVCITKLSPSGSSLVYSSYLGGAGDETAYGIAIDGAGAAYVTGSTLSADFPTTAGAFWTEHNDDEEAFVSKLSADGGSLVYSTFLGGESYGVGSAIAVDGTGAACVAGQTGASDFPTTVDAYDRSLDGPSDAFVTKLNADGSALVFSTLLGGSDDDYASGVALDGGGAAIVVGSTYSVDLPAGGYDTSLGGLGDGFVAKLAAGGSSLVFATYLGGADYDDICAVAVDGAGAIYVAGYTSSTDYPTTADAYATKKLDYEDAFVTKLNATGAALTYSTYLGGSGTDRGYGIAVNAPGTAAVVTGYTTDIGYPTTSGAFGTTFSGRSDAFVTKIAATTVQPTTLTVNAASGAPGASVSLTAKLADGGGAGVSGKSVAYTLDATGIGSATTAATGISTLAYTITDTLSAGAHTLGGAFAGDAAYDPSSGSNTLTVTQAATGLSTVDRTGLVTTVVALKAYLKRTTDNAWLGGRSVAFTVAGTGVGSANTDASGQAVLNYTIATSAGAHAIGVSFAAETLYKASSAAATLTATTTN
ncbi:MAG: SBBP repeat-containing protein, partial [Armatimonadetes bacterium]|nr:SBBP repeat-containing protein [Armatimonadota bacterium]